MIYLRSFQLSDSQISNPHIYPYSVFRNKDIEPFVFTPITVFYGNNGSGKSTLLKMLTGMINRTSGEIIYKEKHDSMFYIPIFCKKHQRIIYNNQFNTPYDKLNWIPSHAKNFH